jgi:hypothetical protein
MPRLLFARLLIVVSGLSAAQSACARVDEAPPVATVAFSASKARASLGSPIDLTYRFSVAPDRAIGDDYRVFVHWKRDDGSTLWNDDHVPPTPTSRWRAGETIEYTRTRFLPMVTYLGEATIEMGLYRDQDRLPLQGADPADRQSGVRSYKVGTVQLLPSSENVFVIRNSGWHPGEFAPEDPTLDWQWTQKLATATFRNPRRDVLVYLEFDGRPDLFAPAPQQLTVSVGAQIVGTVAVGANTPSLHRLGVTTAQLGTAEMAELRLEVDRTFVPAKLPAGGRDTRELGIRVYHLFVEGR